METSKSNPNFFWHTSVLYSDLRIDGTSDIFMNWNRNWNENYEFLFYRNWN